MCTLLDCPFETGIKLFENENDIVWEKLTFEMEMMGDKSPDEALKGTVLDGNTDFIVVKEDEKLAEAYMDHSIHYMLPGSVGGRKSGLERLMKAIEEGNERLSSADDLWDNIVGGENEDILLECVPETIPGEMGPEETGRYLLSYASESRKGKQVIARLHPCCRNCNKRLPDKWLLAEKLIAITLLGYTGCGKTMLKQSFLSDGLEALSYLGEDWCVYSAHNEDEAYYEKILTDIEHMTAANGKAHCCGNTQTEAKVAPIFCAVNYRNHYMMIAIYDSAGEVLAKMSEKDPRVQLLADADAHIYLIEPSQMQVELSQKEKKEVSGFMKTLTVEEQSSYQKEHIHEFVSGEEVLRAAGILGKSEKKRTEDPLKMLREYQRLLNQRYGPLVAKQKMKRQHLCATVVKCDKLIGLPEMEEVANANILFNRISADEQVELYETKQDVARELFTKYVFTDKRQKEFVERTMGSHSYHCISSLGCDTTTKKVDGVEVDYLLDEYNPINVSEPFVAILMKKVHSFGWDR